jgi:acetyl esterase/lipase
MNSFLPRAIFAAIRFSLLAAPLLLGSRAIAESTDVRVEKDVAYLPADRAEKADLYLPADDTHKHPGVVIIHGGGWTGGEKGAAREQNIGNTLASHGYVCMSINYLLADPKAHKGAWPQNLYDCKTAVRWMRANAARLHLDPEHIGAIGGSAGGHLATMLDVTRPKDGLDPDGPYGEFSCHVACAVDMYGPVDLENWKDITALLKSRKEDPELYKKFSAMTYLDKDTPPILILHGTADTIVDLQQSKSLDAALEKLGVEHHLEIVEGAPHSFHLQPKQKDLRPLVLEFFAKHLGGEK